MRGLLLDSPARSKLQGAARLLDSDRPGEVAAAVAAIDRLLPNGITLSGMLTDAFFEDVPGRNWKELAGVCLSAGRALSAKEYAFACSMILRDTAPTPKQLAWLTDLSARVEGGRP